MSFKWIEKKNKNWAAYSDKSACSIASGGSGSVGGNSTATLGNDYPSLSTSDDFPEEFEFSTNDGKNAQFIPKIKTNKQLITTCYGLDYNGNYKIRVKSIYFF